MLCLICGGECFYLGTLGRREHWCCRDCGMNQSRAVLTDDEEEYE